MRIAVVAEPLDRAVARCPAVADAHRRFDWRTEAANMTVAVPGYDRAPRSPVDDRALDLLDLAVGVYAADIAVRRGERESWPRAITLTMPVRDPDFWRATEPTLAQLLYTLTHDSLRLDFYPAPEDLAGPRDGAWAGLDIRPDCVSMLSGGLDSLAGAVMLLSTGRRVAFTMHRSGNPLVRAAQEASIAALERHWPGAGVTCAATVTPEPRGRRAHPLPPPEQREPSRRARSLLFMALAALTARGAGVGAVFMCENGLLNTGLPLSPARAGSMSTQSTHPVALARFNDIAARIGLGLHLSNPFVYQTKGELVRDLLAPHLTPREIQSTVSCWALGRYPRPCGGCLPCLIRRLAMAWADLPEEAHMIDLLGEPRSYVGTTAWGNLVDLLRHARQLQEMGDAEVLGANPGLLLLPSAGLSLPDVIAMLRRHADQTLTVVRRRYPRAAELVASDRCARPGA